MMGASSIMLGKYPSLLLLGGLGICLAQTPNLPSIYSISGELRPQAMKLDKLAAGSAYSVLFSANSPADLGPDARVMVSVVEGEHVLLAKTLHAGDADLYGTIRPAAGASLRVATEGGAEGALPAADQSRARSRRRPTIPGAKRRR